MEFLWAGCGGQKGKDLHTDLRQWREKSVTDATRSTSPPVVKIPSTSCWEAEEDAHTIASIRCTVLHPLPEETVSLHAFP